MATTIAQNLFAEYEQIKVTGLWRQYTIELERARKWYATELRGNKKIGATMTYGEHWQESLKRIETILTLPEKIIEDARKASDNKNETPE